jgi:antitoxin component YwqK of YwqJK toxin-antitoxin module
MKKPYRTYHNDGSLWAKGFLDNDTMVGNWTWFRKDGSKMRTGTFADNKQIGKWTTYDKKGTIVKVTMLGK